MCPRGTVAVVRQNNLGEGEGGSQEGPRGSEEVWWQWWQGQMAWVREMEGPRRVPGGLRRCGSSSEARWPG